MEKSLLGILIIATFLFCISCDAQKEFQQLKYDWKEDIIGQLASGFNPKTNINQWALLKGDNFYKKTRVLFKSGLKENNLTFSPVGFFNACHPTGCSYYIAAKENDEIIYITNKEELLDFLGGIDSMEEALLLSIINGFQIDPNDKKGSSYIRIADGFKFSLMKPNPVKYQFRQYIVRIDKSGNLKEEKKEIYCRGLKDCEKL